MGSYQVRGIKLKLKRGRLRLKLILKEWVGRLRLKLILKQWVGKTSQYSSQKFPK